MIFSLFSFAISKGQDIEQRENIDNQLIVTHVVIPRYFAAALATRSQGEVTIEVKISPEGNVTEAKTISGNKILGGNSLYVVKMWKFNPSLNKKTRRTEITFSYKLVTQRESSTEGLSVFKLPFRIEIIEVLQEEKPTFTQKVKSKKAKSTK